MDEKSCRKQKELSEEKREKRKQSPPCGAAVFTTFGIERC
jgi:hypothetical protein